MSSSEGATGPQRPSSSSSPRKPGLPIGVGGSGATIGEVGKHATGPPPKTITPKIDPSAFTSPLPYGAVAPEPSASVGAPASLPADLNDSWHSLMTSVGTTVPYHLNRTVRVAQLMRRGSR